MHSRSPLRGGLVWIEPLGQPPSGLGSSALSTHSLWQIRQKTVGYMASVELRERREGGTGKGKIDTGKGRATMEK